MSICLRTEGCGFITWCTPDVSNCDNHCGLYLASLPIIRGNGYPGHNCYKLGLLGKSDFFTKSYYSCHTVGLNMCGTLMKMLEQAEHIFDTF